MNGRTVIPGLIDMHGHMFYTAGNVFTKDGKLALNMVGDPQLGNLNVPLGMLPFNLKDQVATAINKVNNDLIISEINNSLVAGFGSADFVVQGVSTDDSGMTIRLQHP